MNTNAAIVSDETVTVYCNNKVHTISKEAARSSWDSVLAAVKERDWVRLLKLIDIIGSTRDYIEGSSIYMKESTLFYKGKTVNNSLSRKIIQMQREGADITAMVAFMENLMLNPSYHSVEELYQFLQKSNLPITDDGCFLAYKRVNNDYTDTYTSKISNKIGCKPFMERNAVDDDRRKDCSHGLHFCSLGYLAGFSGPRLMLLKINPKDVVSVPYEYDDTKGRCCSYEVIDELNLDAYVVGDKVVSRDEKWDAVLTTDKWDDVHDNCAQEEYDREMEMEAGRQIAEEEASQEVKDEEDRIAEEEEEEFRREREEEENNDDNDVRY
ncbi:MAG: hypothetical protein DRI46_09290 [Chloroflexi bacterium]|nr:MAG: hypothetical protein DRI46_09290 [Chloroflexota bacterium]